MKHEWRFLRGKRPSKRMSFQIGWCFHSHVFAFAVQWRFWHFAIGRFREDWLRYFRNCDLIE